MKKLIRSLLILSIFVASCNWFKKPPLIGKVLSEHFKNKLYTKFDSVIYDSIFVRKRDSFASHFSNPKVLKAFYQLNGNDPVFVTNFFINGQLDTLQRYLGDSGLHGINPKIFQLEEMKVLLTKLTSNKATDLKQIYPVIADLELLSANAYLNYTNYLRYGIVNPRRVVSRYYINVRRPDSAKMMKTLSSVNLADTLAAVQPKSEQYLALQKAFIAAKDVSTKRVLSVNMERRRWQLPNLGTYFVQVNVPDFKLTWFDKLDTLITMKVVVGGKREKNYDEKWKAYKKSGNINDRPKNHETPLLYSKINSIQANPVWNIPVSIAQNEIYWMARKDPYYLSNSNINVYYKGKLLGEPDTINWTRYPSDKLPFKFKQGPGGGNALGKFKFIFDNDFSIYLHDTNNKSGFRLVDRAISHGCVRIENPLDFARLLVNSPYSYDKLRVQVDLPPIDSTHNSWYVKRMAERADTSKVFKMKSSWFGPKKPVPLIITYFTAWYQNNEIQYCPDVYSHDEQIWAAMKKFR
ncbi:murein L,D-transpeptidase YcbB/YkuD [Pedobacter sp. UYP30]|uniref:L,D-transpeptidase family protein n=1 Tax=Pedobacter sp. UYP30 TaxID=1756400 RepID=UPI0033981E93